ncbi:M3 family metallopeptidase [Candidatus Berkiella cookevillensis]|uniref:oligopeptidase A n=1 Tax=Candidatus Berkiella cookevillensis TaxID=437022 RepID=A0A0Q9YR38_9GAMM|nr:M3 family metallopeptidase [Candidatus Berkiella cookevillensis]MCS5707307.1 M3 family metallopeptidase [Candidatus Berkiella cookevillensis]
MSNPLLTEYELPPFKSINVQDIMPAIENVLDDNLKKIEKLTTEQPKTWADLIKPLEALDDRLHRAWSPVRHLNAVMSSEALRKAYNECLPKISDYSTQVGQNKALYEAFLAIKNAPEFSNLDSAQKKVIQNALRDFKLQGIALSPEKQAQFKSLKKQLSELESKFQDNVLDATDHWHMDIEDSAKLAGVPEADLALFAQKATENKVSGYRLTLDFPCYYAIATYAKDRKLRETMHEAYVTRASDQGPSKGNFDNSAIIVSILKIRDELAKLLDYPTYAHYSLEKKMAPSVNAVMSFLEELALKAKPFAQKEINELETYAKKQDNIDRLQPWDTSFYSEKLREEQFSISQEELRPYFPAHKVIEGMFKIVNKTFGISVKPIHSFDAWHDSVQLFEVIDKDNLLRGKFYLDLYARPKKRQGAWMDDAIGRRKKVDASLQTPVAYITCNFRPGMGDEPALLTHDEVVTLFHEFGHALHHMLTQIDHLDISGISGVPWDAVELPSQFLENWCWQKEALPIISSHYQDQKPLPEEMFNKLLRTKNFLSGMHIARQIEFALFDFRIHLEFDSQQKNQVQTILDEVRKKVAVVPAASYNRFQNSFTHIFSGGYCAGYYSYLWAEVLASDAFSRFKEEGLFNPQVGAAFMQHILEKGGSEEPEVLFRLFRGRAHKIDYLLEDYGLLVS